MKKHSRLAALAGLTLVLVAASAIWLNAASGANRTEKIETDANGNTVAAFKDFSDTDGSGSIWAQPMHNSRGPFRISASEQDRSQIQSLIKRSIELEYSAMVTSNGDKVPEVLAEYPVIYSNELGDADKHAGYPAINASLLKQDGLKCTKFELTRFELKGLKLDGKRARAIVKDESTCVREKVSENPGPDRIELKNGRQSEYVLQREDGSWRILKDRWVFLPGFEP